MGSANGLHKGHIWAGPCNTGSDMSIQYDKIEAGADSGFLDSGFKFTKGGSN